MKILVKVKGGPGSGNFGYAGIPGSVGGSMSNFVGMPTPKATMGGYVGTPEYTTYLRDNGVSAETQKSIEDAFYHHAGEAEEQRVADQQLGEWWADKDSPEGKALRVISALEEHACRFVLDYQSASLRKDLETLESVKPGEVPVSKYFDAEDIVGTSPKSEYYVGDWETKRDGILYDLRQPDYVYRKSAADDSSKAILSFTRSASGANFSPITGGSKLLPDVKLNLGSRHGYRILYGYARQHGRPGEAEVLMVRD